VSHVSRASRSAFAIALGLGLALTTPLAHAQTDAQRAEAQAAMERGIAAATAGDPSAALAEYAHAAELVPEANLPHRYAGEAYESLARFAEAIDSYELYLKKNPQVKDKAMIEARIKRLRAKHLDAEISITCRPLPGDVYVDDSPEKIGTTPLSSIAVRAGDHRFRIRHPGYDDATYELRLAAGSSVAIPCELKPTRAEHPFGPPQPEPPAPGDARKTWGFITLGTGVTLLVGSLVLDLTWLGSTIDDFHAAEASGDGGARGLEKRAHTLQTTLAITYVTGAVLTATGAGLLLWRAASPPSSPSQALRTNGRELTFTATW
jgi:tetratricopeptide (TPR) repeat protein